MLLNIQNQERILESFQYRAYHNKTLCAVDCLKEYLKCHNTKVQTDTKGLFVRYGNLLGQQQSLQWEHRWKSIQSILKEYTPHTYTHQISCYQQSKSIECRHCRVLKQGCWKNAKIICNFYKKDIICIFTFMLGKQNVYNTINVQRI